MNCWGSDVIVFGRNFGCHSGFLKNAEIEHFFGFSTDFAHKSLNSEKWLEVIYLC